MTRKAIINRTIRVMSQLPDEEAQEISNFAEFISKRYEELLLNQGMQRMVSDSDAFRFLNDEEELYTEADLKEKFSG